VAESRDGAVREVLLATATYEGWMDSCAGYANGCRWLMQGNDASARRGSRDLAIAMACRALRNLGVSQTRAIERFRHPAAQIG
jgi:hypothetical protein